MSSYVTQVVIEGKDGTKAAVASASKGIQSYAKVSRAANKTVQASSRAARSSIQQIGYQAQDVAVQLQAGQNPFLVLSQQGSQVASIFGPGGAVAGAFIAIAGIIGMNLVPSLFESSDAMEELKEKAKELNKELGEIAPYAAGRAEYQDARNQIELQEKIAEKVREINELREEATKLANARRPSFSDLNENAEDIQEATIALENYAVQLSTHQKQIEGLKEVYNPFIRVYDEYLKREEERQKLILDAETPLQTLQRRTQELIVLEKEYGLGKEWLSSMIKKEGDAYESTLPKKKKDLDILKEKYTTTNAFMVAYEQYLSQQEEGKELAESLITPLEELQQKTDRYRELLELGAISQETFNRAMLAAGEAYGSSFDKADDAKSALKEYAESAANLDKQLEDAAMGGIKSIEDGFVNMINGSESAADAFKNMAKSIVDDLIRIQIQRSITGPLAGMLGDGGSSGGIFDGLKSFFNMSFAGGGYTGMGARSGGVDGKGGFPAILHPNETVVDHSQGQTINDGGVTINQTIQISTGVSQTVRAEIANLMPQITNATKAAVADARQRGGGFSKSLVGA